MKNLIAAGTAVVAVVSTFALTGCNSDGAVAEQTVITKVVTKSAAAAAADAAPSQAASTPAATDDSVDDSGSGNDQSSGLSVVKFGDTYKFKGWSVSISAPKPYTPSEYAATDQKHPTYRAMTVTVKNTSRNKGIDPNLINISTQVGDAEGDSVYDDGVGDTPSASVLPGRSVSWKIAYGAKVGDQITVQVSDLASFDGPVAAFDGKIS